nr:DNA-processing protein DprA [Clostridia bacterium]
MLDYTHWIWLSEAIGQNTPVSDLLFAHFGYDASAVYNADIDEYSKALPEKYRTKLSALINKDLTEAKKILAYCQANNIGIIPACAKHYYPAQLRRIKNKPVLLYYRGKLLNLEERLNIAMVGTRSITEYGKRMAYTVSYDLAGCGTVIVSGMALGIDGMSHLGALDSGGLTVAVLGCGVDRAYPSEHSEMMERIMQNGMVISEYRPFTTPVTYNFPARNRIISGLSQGCIIIESGVKGGSLITAKYAVEQGRRLFAVPGKAGEASSAGTNRLIQEGAYMVTSAPDVIAHFEKTYADKLDLSAVMTIKKRILTLPQSEVTQTRPHTSPKRGTAGRTKIKDSTASEALLQLNTSVSDTSKAAENVSAADTDNTDLNNKHPSVKQKPEDIGVIDIGIREDKTDDRSDAPKYVMDEYEQKIYSLTSFIEPISTDELISKGLPVAKVLIGLTKLEIEGFVKTISGGKFIRLK